MPRNLSSVAEAMTAFMRIIGLSKESLRKILLRVTHNFFHLRRAAHSLIAKMKEKSFDRVMEIVEMEKLTDYTCSPEYMTEWAKFMAHQNAFTEVMNDNSKPSQVTIEGFGEIEVGHLRFHSSTKEQAFDMKMRITAYWKIVLKRFVDSLALHLLLSINELVNRNMEIEIVNELIGSHGGGIERMLEESPPVALKRERLNKSIRLLKNSKEVVAQIMDRITVSGD
ncbi:Dynamin-related protein 4C [Camellia lanceoleosa]|uniref:Dynamin-related protein 4C n=1 Tax=Camellia lanceoleosa TaxID=1840588 RepID=A0ACC0II29_9ERIC|nr:Dynamin-related protein 4C [Camellia lanceoleosa]